METALTDPDEHEFFVREDARRAVITGKAMGLGEALNVASHAVEGQQRRPPRRCADRSQLERRAEAWQPGQP